MDSFVVSLLFRYLVYTAFSYVVISFYEYLIHRYFMHSTTLLQGIYRRCPYAYEVFASHAIRHHGRWYAKFNYEPDPVGRQENLTIKALDTFLILAVMSPVWGAVMWLSWEAGFTIIVVLIIHNALWNMVHTEMHIPSGAFFRNFPPYRFLARYHFMHHQRGGRNFNVVFPLADFVFSTVAHPSAADVQKMLCLGLLSEREIITFKSTERNQGVNPVT